MTSDGSNSPDCNRSCTFEDDDSDTCTCRSVASLVGDISSLRTAAYVTASEYKDTSRRTVDSLSLYAAARAEYDAEYAANKTGVWGGV